MANAQTQMLPTPNPPTGAPESLPDSIEDALAPRLDFFGELLDDGISVMRRSAALSVVSTFSQSLFLTYFTAPASMTVTALAYVQGTTASATITRHQLALYSVDADDAITLEASTTNDTALGTTANTRYSKALSTPFGIIKGNRYAVGKLLVATTAGNAAGAGAATSGMAAAFARSPKAAAGIAAQTTLPAGPVATQDFASALYFELIGA